MPAPVPKPCPFCRDADLLPQKLWLVRSDTVSYKNPGCFIATRVCRSAERRHGEPGFPMTETRALHVRPYSPSASSVPPKKSPVPSDGFQRNRRPQPFYKSDAAVACGKGFEPPCCRFTSRQLRLRCCGPASARNSRHMSFRRLIRVLPLGFSYRWLSI